VKLNIELDPYEAFMKFGYEDGDDPGAEWGVEKVAAALRNINWGTEAAGGLHNNYIFRVFRGETDIEFGDQFSYAGTGEEVREALLRMGLDDVVRTLDTLRNQ